MMRRGTSVCGEALQNAGASREDQDIQICEWYRSAQSAAAAGYRLLCVSPPYQTSRELATTVPGPLPRGSVLLLMVNNPGKVAQSDLAEVVSGARRLLCLPVTLHLQRTDSLSCCQLVSRAYLLGIHAVLIGTHGLRDALWHLLSDPADLADEWLGWMRLQREISLQSGEFIRHIVRAAPEHSSITDLCKQLKIPSRTLRYHLEKDGLPKAERWFDGARLLDAQLQLQRNPTLEIGSVAAALGYEDPISFCKQIHRLFGVTAEVSRKLLGLEWRFREWLARAERKEGL